MITQKKNILRKYYSSETNAPLKILFSRRLCKCLMHLIYNFELHPSKLVWKEKTLSQVTWIPVSYLTNMWEFKHSCMTKVVWSLVVGVERGFPDILHTVTTRFSSHL